MADPLSNQPALRMAARVVLAAPVLYSLVEVGRMGLLGWRRELTVAIIATAVFLPIHLWHISYGLRGERPPRGGVTLAVMAVVQIAALLLVGKVWTYALAPLAVSALVVLRTPFALGVLAACMLGPLWCRLAGSPDRLPMGVTDISLGNAVLLRAVVQFTLVWLAAAAYQLAATRAALAAETVMRERKRLEAQVRGSLERGLVTLADSAGRARTALTSPGVSAVLIAVDRVLAVSRQALADLRTIVGEARTVEDNAAASALAASARSRRTPIGGALGLQGAWLRWALAHAVFVSFPLLMMLGLVYTEVPLDPVGVVAWVPLAGFVLLLSSALARGRRSWWRWWCWAAIVGLSAGLLPVLGPNWVSAVWLAAVPLALMLRGRLAFASVTAIGVASIVYAYLAVPQELTAYQLAWGLFYPAVQYVLGDGGLWAAGKLVPVLEELHDARRQLATHAARTERRRLSRDLHDVLGQTLTAISLKGELARRLIARDRAAAAHEVEALDALARSLLDDLATVARDERRVAFATETAASIALLESAGIAVQADVRLDGLGPVASSVLGWAVREGTTNVLRHARARSCEIRARRADGVVSLEVVNDGVLGRNGDGTGLISLADRAAACHGAATGGPVGDGHFRLRVELPEPSS